MASPWPREAFARAVFSSDLKPLERLVALVYADYAGSDAFAWVTLDQLRSRTGMSRDAVNRARKGLVAKGWLVEKDTARQHRAARYWLVQGYGSRTAEDARGTSPGHLDSPRGTGDRHQAPSRGTGADVRGTSPGPDYSPRERERSQQESATQTPDLPDEHRVVAEALVRDHAGALTLEQAQSAVSAIDAKQRPGNLGAYVRRFDLRSLQSWSSAPGPKRTSPASRCPNSCDGGWIGEDTEGRPIACRACKPHLYRDAS